MTTIQVEVLSCKVFSKITCRLDILMEFLGEQDITVKLTA